MKVVSGKPHGLQCHYVTLDMSKTQNKETYIIKFLYQDEDTHWKDGVATIHIDERQQKRKCQHDEAELCFVKEFPKAKVKSITYV
jgi:hypothetical protein